jgi:prepilin-type N-terminal cleavage/methylation domain-containing protein
MDFRRMKPSGFTLVEIVIVLIIASVLLAAIVSLARPYFEEKQRIRNEDVIRTVEQALADYFEQVGAFPCPAPLDTARGTAEDGTSDCTDPPTQTGISAVDGRDGRRVLIGAVPYRDLGIATDSTIDSYANRLTYAVSFLSTTTAYNDGTDTDGDTLVMDDHTGAIDILDHGGNSLLDVVATAEDESGSAHVFFFSHGRDGKGSFTDGGQANGDGTCTGGVDEENCDGDAAFVGSKFMSMGTEAEYYDDFSIYSIAANGEDEDLWDRTPSDTNNIYNLNSGNVGVGDDNPQEKLSVDGDIRLADSADDANGVGQARVSGKISFWENDALNSGYIYGGRSAGSTDSKALHIVLGNTEVGGPYNVDDTSQIFIGVNGAGAGPETGSIALRASRVGVGTNNPEAKLDILNSSPALSHLKLSGNSNNDQSYIKIVEPGNHGFERGIHMILDGDGDDDNDGVVTTSADDLFMHLQSCTGVTDSCSPALDQFIFWTDGEAYMRGPVGVGVEKPTTKLDVAGEVKIGNSGLTCPNGGVGPRGAVRYNTTTDSMEFCSVTGWRPVGAGNVTLLASNKPVGSSTTIPANTCSIIEVQAVLKGWPHDPPSDYNFYKLTLTMRSNGSSLAGPPVEMNVRKGGASGHFWGFGGTTGHSYFIQNTSTVHTISGDVDGGYPWDGVEARYNILCY